MDNPIAILDERGDSITSLTDKEIQEDIERNKNYNKDLKTDEIISKSEIVYQNSVQSEEKEGRNNTDGHSVSQENVSFIEIVSKDEDDEKVEFDREANNTNQHFQLRRSQSSELHNSPNKKDDFGKNENNRLNRLGLNSNQLQPSVGDIVQENEYEDSEDVGILVIQKRKSNSQSEISKTIKDTQSRDNLSDTYQQDSLEGGESQEYIKMQHVDLDNKLSELEIREEESKIDFPLADEKHCEEIILTDDPKNDEKGRNISNEENNKLNKGFEKPVRVEVAHKEIDNELPSNSTFKENQFEIQESERDSLISSDTQSDQPIEYNLVEEKEEKITEYIAEVIGETFINTIQTDQLNKNASLNEELNDIASESEDDFDDPKYRNRNFGRPGTIKLSSFALENLRLKDKNQSCGSSPSLRPDVLQKSCTEPRLASIEEIGDEVGIKHLILVTTPSKEKLIVASGEKYMVSKVIEHGQRQADLAKNIEEQKKMPNIEEALINRRYEVFQSVGKNLLQLAKISLVRGSQKSSPNPSGTQIPDKTSMKSCGEIVDDPRSSQLKQKNKKINSDLEQNPQSLPNSVTEVPEIKTAIEQELGRSSIAKTIDTAYQGTKKFITGIWGGDISNNAEDSKQKDCTPLNETNEIIETAELYKNIPAVLTPNEDMNPEKKEFAIISNELNRPQENENQIKTELSEREEDLDHISTQQSNLPEENNDLNDLNNKEREEIFHSNEEYIHPEFGEPINYIQKDSKIRKDRVIEQTVLENSEPINIATSYHNHLNELDSTTTKAILSSIKIDENESLKFDSFIATEGNHKQKEDPTIAEQAIKKNTLQDTQMEATIVLSELYSSVVENPHNNIEKKASGLKNPNFGEVSFMGKNLSSSTTTPLFFPLETTDKRSQGPCLADQSNELNPFKTKEIECEERDPNAEVQDKEEDVSSPKFNRQESDHSFDLISGMFNSQIKYPMQEEIELDIRKERELGKILSLELQAYKGKQPISDSEIIEPENSLLPPIVPEKTVSEQCSIDSSSQKVFDEDKEHKVILRMGDDPIESSFTDNAHNSFVNLDSSRHKSDFDISLVKDSSKPCKYP